MQSLSGMKSFYADRMHLKKFLMCVSDVLILFSGVAWRVLVIKVPKREENNISFCKKSTTSAILAADNNIIM